MNTNSLPQSLQTNTLSSNILNNTSLRYFDHLSPYRLTWSFAPHPPTGGFAHKPSRSPLLPLSAATPPVGLTSKPHHAHGIIVPLMWIVSPATGIDFQPQTRFRTQYHYTWLFPKTQTISCVFFDFFKNFFEILFTFPSNRRIWLLDRRYTSDAKMP